MEEVNIFDIVIGQIVITAVAFLCKDMQKKLKKEDDEFYEFYVFSILAIYSLFNIICLICHVW
jgi:hypothetical protein